MMKIKGPQGVKVYPSTIIPVINYTYHVKKMPIKFARSNLSNIANIIRG